MRTATKKRGKKEKPLKPSKKLGSLIDGLYAFDQKIHSAESALGKLKKKRAVLEYKLRVKMEDSDLEKAAGVKSQAGIQRRTIYNIKNPVKFQKYVKKNDAFDLYQNRVASRALIARLEEGEAVPGIGKFEKVSVSIRKRG
jgi:hypothetical protein